MGFEYIGKPAAALGKGDKGADLAVMMKHWIRMSWLAATAPRSGQTLRVS